MLDSSVLAFTGIALLLTITPGPDTMLVMRSVVARGQRAGLLTTIGICSGLFIGRYASSIGLTQCPPMYYGRGTNHHHRYGGPNDDSRL